MNDREFLEWVRDRLVAVYGESPNVDFVLRLGRIAEAMEEPAPSCLDCGAPAPCNVDHSEDIDP